MIVNQPVQGPASALIQIAQNDLRSLWITKGWWMTKAYICNSVHDEIVVYCDEDIAEEAKLDVRDCMEGCQRLLDVPLRAEPKICNSWSEK